MSSLRERLVERIRAHGPLTFAQYMEAALFDPESGFYTRGPGIGQGGHFATAAMAWAGSSAGMMPSVRQRSWKPSIASSSVTEV